MRSMEPKPVRQRETGRRREETEGDRERQMERDGEYVCVCLFVCSFVRLFVCSFVVRAFVCLSTLFVVPILGGRFYKSCGNHQPSSSGGCCCYHPRSLCLSVPTDTQTQTQTHTDTHMLPPPFSLSPPPFFCPALPPRQPALSRRRHRSWCCGLSSGPDFPSPPLAAAAVSRARTAG